MLIDVKADIGSGRAGKVVHTAKGDSIDGMRSTEELETLGLTSLVRPALVPLLVLTLAGRRARLPDDIPNMLRAGTSPAAYLSPL